MSDIIKKTRFFTIADFKEEEKWLRKMHRDGWKLAYMKSPCFFYFERCEPEDVVYQLDFRNRRDGDGVEYRQMFQDFGWEYVGSCLNFHYFRKPVKSMEGEEEIFSDNESRIDFLVRIWKWRMMPIFVILFGCVLPQVHGGLIGRIPWDFMFFAYCVLAFIYILLILYVGIKLSRIKRSLRQSC